MNKQYPIGNFEYGKSYTFAKTKAHIQIIEGFVPQLRDVVGKLQEADLQTPYREGGWTRLQVVHHLADSHMNSFIRFKLALTEDNPVIKPYEEQLWAIQPDYNLPAELSLNILESLHKRWAVLLNSLQESDFARTFQHPQTQKTLKLSEVCALYAWHGAHHLAHISMDMPF